MKPILKNPEMNTDKKNQYKPKKNSQGEDENGSLELSPQKKQSEVDLDRYHDEKEADTDSNSIGN